MNFPFMIQNDQINPAYIRHINKVREELLSKIAIIRMRTKMKAQQWNEIYALKDTPLSTGGRLRWQLSLDLLAIQLKDLRNQMEDVVVEVLHLEAVNPNFGDRG